MIGTTGTAIGRSVLRLIALCLLAQRLPAQASDFNIPPNTILPNYNRVALGQREALEGGALGIVATNTTVAREGLRSPAALTGQAGGLSGVPLKKRATETCRILYAHLGHRVPIIGVGGIFTAADAYERIRAGATLVQLYTALIYEGPGVVSRIVRGMSEYLARDGFSSISEAVGTDGG